MVNPYSSIINYDEGDDFFDEYLNRMHLLHIFKDLLQEFPEKEVFKGVVWFILWGYSVQSDMLQTNGLTWSKLSQLIFDKTGLDKKYFEKVAELESDNVRDAIDRWLIYQNDESFSQFITYRDLRKQFLSASLLPLPKATTKVTASLEGDGLTVEKMEADLSRLKSLVEAKMLCATNSEQLLKMMNDAKERFIQTQPKLKISVSELNKVTHQKSTRTTEEIFAGNG